MKQHYQVDIYKESSLSYKAEIQCDDKTGHSIHAVIYTHPYLSWVERDLHAMFDSINEEFKSFSISKLNIVGCEQGATHLQYISPRDPSPIVSINSYNYLYNEYNAPDRRRYI